MFTIFVISLPFFNVKQQVVHIVTSTVKVPVPKTTNILLKGKELIYLEVHHPDDTNIRI